MEDQENSNANTTSTKISHGSTQSQGWLVLFIFI